MDDSRVLDTGNILPFSPREKPKPAASKPVFSHQDYTGFYGSMFYMDEYAAAACLLTRRPPFRPQPSLRRDPRLLHLIKRMEELKLTIVQGFKETLDLKL